MHYLYANPSVHLLDAPAATLPTTFGAGGLWVSRSAPTALPTSFKAEGGTETKSFAKHHQQEMPGAGAYLSPLLAAPPVATSRDWGRAQKGLLSPLAPHLIAIGLPAEQKPALRWASVVAMKMTPDCTRMEKQN